MDLAIRVDLEDQRQNQQSLFTSTNNLLETLRSKGLLVSILGHFTLFLALILLQNQQKLDTPWMREAKVKPIKSYIVFNTPKTLPQKVVEPELPQIEAPTPAKQEQTVAAPQPTQDKQNMQVSEPKPVNFEPAESKQVKPESVVQEAAPKTQVKVNQPKVMTGETSTKKVKPFSAFGSLKQFNEKLDQEMIWQDRENQNSTDPSIFNPNPTLIPKQEVTTPIYKQKKVAVPSSSANKVYRNMKTGTCTLEQDMSHVGFQRHTAISQFDCGETESERNFREHMKKYGKHREQ